MNGCVRIFPCFLAGGVASAFCLIPSAALSRPGYDFSVIGDWPYRIQSGEAADEQ